MSTELQYYTDAVQYDINTILQYQGELQTYWHNHSPKHWRYLKNTETNAMLRKTA